MTGFQPADPDFQSRTKESFARQAVMKTFGAEMVAVAAGRVELMMKYNGDLTQQHGFLHAGVVSTVLDSACGYAGFTLMHKDAAVLTIEFKINLLAPAKGDTFRFVGEVLKPGKTITVCDGKAFALDAGKEKLIASMNCTLMAMIDRGIRG